MHVFVDESGRFAARPGSQPSVCCVATLAVPDSCLEGVHNLHGRLLSDWNLQGAELKGSTLTEEQFHEAIESLSAMDIVLGIVSIDMALHTEQAITEHKRGQAERIRASAAGPEFAETLRREMHEWAARLEGLSNQLYVQSGILSIAVHRTLQTTTLHYAQTEPTTLGSIAWRVDAKDKVLTEYESLWTDIVKPILQTLSMKEPLFTVTEFDYSAMTPFENEVRENIPAHLRPGLAPGHPHGPFHSFDVRKFMRDLTFGDSRADGGLQLIDILANAFQRACNGRLQERGWGRLGRLMVENFRTHRAVDCRMLSSAGPPQSLLRTPYWNVLERLDGDARGWEVTPPKPVQPS